MLETGFCPQASPPCSLLSLSRLVCFPLIQSVRLERCWSLWTVLCRILLPLPLLPHSYDLLGGCFPQHVYDLSLCAQLSCPILLLLSSSGRTAGNNLMPMKRKRGVTNKAKFKGLFLQYVRHSAKRCQRWADTSKDLTEFTAWWVERMRNRTIHVCMRVHAKYGQYREKGRSEVLWD